MFCATSQWMPAASKACATLAHPSSATASGRPSSTGSASTVTCTAPRAQLRTEDHAAGEHALAAVDAADTFMVAEPFCREIATPTRGSRAVTDLVQKAGV